MAGQGEEEAHLGQADVLEEVADDYLCPDDGEHGHADAQAVGCHVYQHVVAGEDGRHGVGQQLADEEAAGGDAHAPGDGQAQGLLHAVGLAGAEVVADDGLHAHGQAHDNHQVEHQEAVDDAVGADGHVAPVVAQGVVDDDDDDAGRHVHQEGGHADGEDVAHDAPLQMQEASLQADVVMLVEKVVQHPKHADELRDDGGQCRPAYAPAELEDEQRRQDDVAQHAGHRRQHRLLGMARGAHHVVHANHHVGKGRACQDDLHEIPRVGQRLVACAEEAQDVVQENQGQSPEDDGVDDAEHQRVAQHLVDAFRVFLPQPDGGDGGAARRNQVAEGGRQVHHREGDGQARDGHGAYAVADEDAVDDVVERHDGHADDGRDGVLQQQLADRLRAHEVWIVLIHTLMSLYNI